MILGHDSWSSFSPCFIHPIYHYLSMVHLQRLTTYPKLWVLPGCKISTTHGWCKVLGQSGLRTCPSTLILSHWLTRELMDRLLKWSEVDEVDVRLARTGVGPQHSHPRLSTWSYLPWGYSQLSSVFFGYCRYQFFRQTHLQKREKPMVATESIFANRCKVGKTIVHHPPNLS